MCQKWWKFGKITNNAKILNFHQNYSIFLHIGIYYFNFKIQKFPKFTAKTQKLNPNISLNIKDFWAPFLMLQIQNSTYINGHFLNRSRSKLLRYPVYSHHNISTSDQTNRDPTKTFKNLKIYPSKINKHFFQPFSHLK